jgi:DNA-binding SARP family transcriptional activator/class 3 adenylate cyclase
MDGQDGHRLNGQARPSSALVGSSKGRNHLHMSEEPGSSGTASELGGTVAFLFSDLEGSTELLRRLRGAYPNLIEAHHRLLQETFEQHGGRVVDSQADSFFVVFPRVRDAAAAAIQAQQSVAAYAWPEGVDVRVRIGVHAAEPLVAENRYVGLGIHRAARICAIAHGGQVLLSQAAASLLADSDLPEVRLRDLGEHRLKDFEGRERLYQLKVDGLRSDFPPLRSDQPRRTTERPLEFGLLGPLEVLDEEKRPLPLGGQKQRAVLALLLLERGRVVPTDRLVDRLWGEEPPPTATTSLQNTISRLRKLLGADRLVTKPPGYAVRLESQELDLARFERIVAAARELPPEPRAAALREALALWRGPPLADFQYESFALGEAARLEELHSSVLEDRIDADLEAGRHSELVGELESLVSKYPLRERLRGHLMLALYRCGRQAEALQAYQEARRVLVEELGIEPSARLQELERAILRQEDALAPAPAVPALADHYRELLDALAAGRLVPFLGGGVNVFGRSGNGPWAKGDSGAPEGRDVAAYLADCFECPAEHARELARLSQYVAVTRGSGPLYDELHALFDVDFEPGPIHELLARLPAYLRERGAPNLLVVTTNYDLALERAFLEAGEEFDVVTYIAVGPHRGKFSHLPPSGEPRVIEVANTYTELSPDVRTVILKIHGQVDRGPAREWESFVVSEDDYIDYLAHADIASLMPVTLAARLRRSHFLFLGYAAEEWPLRVFLRRVWGGQRVLYRSWAVEPRVQPFGRELWRHLDVDLLDAPLSEYVEQLEARIAPVPVEGAA